MLPFRLCFSAALALSGLASLTLAATLPLVDRLKSLSPTAREVLKRSTPAAPRFQVYSDQWQSSFPTPSNLQGYTVYTLSFLLISGAADMALSWQQLGSSAQASLLAEYNAAGISVTVALFGSTDAPTSSGYDPIATANSMAAWVLANNVEGVDIDYEDFNAFDASTGAAETWLINFTQQLRTKLPQGQYILTHAPVAPWFSPTMWSGGGYLAIDKSVGALIDWYNVQFYNQGVTEYTTCAGLLTASSSNWPQSALFQIAANGVNLNKLVIGKPATSSSANNGYIDPTTLASCVSQAHSSGWSAGVMVWEYPAATSSWITTVRGSTFPIGTPPPVSPPPTPTSTTSSSASTSPTTTTTTTSPATSPATATTPTTTATSPATTTTPTTTATTTSSSPTSTSTTTCTGVSAWSNTVAYVAGNQVTYNGGLWTANQWNEDEYPGGPSGAWNYVKAC